MEVTSSYLKKAAIRKSKIKLRLKKYIDSQKSLKKCETCRESCEFDYLCCNICGKSYHRKCLKFSKKKFEHLRKTESFICNNSCFMVALPFHDLDDIDFMHDFKGTGEYPCLKCKRDCFENTDCVRCCNCNGWVHFVCSKLSRSEFENIENNFYFCSKKCEKTANIPEIPQDSIQNMKRLIDEKSSKENYLEKPVKTPFTAVHDHFLDVKCSHIEKEEFDHSLLANRHSEISIFQSNIRSLNANIDKYKNIFIAEKKDREMPDILAFIET